MKRTENRDGSESSHRDNYFVFLLARGGYRVRLKRFRCHVVQSSALGVFENRSHVRLNGRRYAEINQFEATVDQQEISRFQVGVDDVCQDKTLFNGEKRRHAFLLICCCITFFVYAAYSFEHFLPVESNERRVDVVVGVSVANHAGKVRVALLHHQQQFLSFLVMLTGLKMKMSTSECQHAYLRYSSSYNSRRRTTRGNPCSCCKRRTSFRNPSAVSLSTQSKRTTFRAKMSSIAALRTW